MQNYARIGIFGILALVALRVGIGWHFYMEGASKIRGGDFSSVGFLNGAKGPLAGRFQNLIWDHDGEFRLNQEQVNRYFAKAADDATKHFGFTDEQLKKVSRLQSRYASMNRSKRYIGKLNDVYADSQEEIYKFWESTERLSAMEDSDMWNDVASLRGQQETIKAERMEDVKDALASIDAVWKQYERQLNMVATPEQYQAQGYFRFRKPGEGPMTTAVVDRIIPVFDMALGILLIIGLLTPFAGWAGALFLISVVLTQMPGYPGTQPTYFQAAEALGCIVLATTNAGRFAGLDFIPWAWMQNRKAAKAAAA